MMRGLAGGVVAAILMTSASGTAGTPAAKPTMWIEPATPEQPALGPRRAVGAVIWVHGLSLNDEDSRAPTPPYVKSLGEQGWDTFRLNRLREADSLEGTGARLAKAARDLRAQGYKSIGIAGQSFGAFAALVAASEDGVADAVIATAPAAYGSFTDSFATWRANSTELYRLLRRVGSTRLMMVFFHGDGYDPGGRGDMSRVILSGRAVHDLIIDQPADLIGHSAASSGLFARRFAGCIGRFIVGEIRTPADEATCETSWGRRPSADLGDGGTGARFGATLAATKPAVSADLAGSWYGFYRNGREVMLNVERLDGERVVASYLLGSGLMAQEQPEATRRVGSFANGELVFDEPALNPLRFRIRADGTLAGTWQARDGGATLDTVLKRMP
ncbi:hypothetical protein N825_36945 [Skermanella stibiiresistens SB22]|uniref:Alpha/beta hydrolase n=2 Tax=Skermanella TaxID=204447 RepID=W9H912_9PROT|nr:hypothetical protein N825_36945 [Skermanella stibiiresistens SB22]